MDPATITAIITTTRRVVKYGQQVFDYIRDDQTAKLGLLQPVRMVVEGPGVGIGDYQSPDHRFKMVSPNINKIVFDLSAFPADETSWWNGPDGIPNDWAGGSIPGSLIHDPLCQFRTDIARELSITEDEVWVWSSGILATVWEYYGGDNLRTAGESWMSYHITRNVRRPYQWIKRRLGFACVILSVIASMGFSGCFGAKRPDWHVTYADPIISVESGVVTTNSVPK